MASENRSYGNSFKPVSLNSWLSNRPKKSYLCLEFGRKALHWTRRYISSNVRTRTFGRVRPAKIRIRAVWSESSLCAFRIPRICHNHEAQPSRGTKRMREWRMQYFFVRTKKTARICRLIWLFVECTNPKARFLKLRLNIYPYYWFSEGYMRRQVTGATAVWVEIYLDTLPRIMYSI